MIRRLRRFYSEELSAIRPTPKLEDHTLSAVRDCLLIIFAATLHIGGRNLMHHAVVTLTHLSQTWPPEHKTEIMPSWPFSLVVLYNVLGSPEIKNGLLGTLFKRTAALLDYPEMISVIFMVAPCNNSIKHFIVQLMYSNKQTNSVALVRERNVPTERPPPVDEVSANFCG